VEKLLYSGSWFRSEYRELYVVL